jgi:hypothetical protein
MPERLPARIGQPSSLDRYTLGVGAIARVGPSTFKTRGNFETR